MSNIIGMAPKEKNLNWQKTVKAITKSLLQIRPLLLQDGTISKNDLRAAFDNVGKLMTESELDDMLGEVGGSCNFDNMIKMFQTKMAGGILFLLYSFSLCLICILTALQMKINLAFRFKRPRWPHRCRLQGLRGGRPQSQCRKIQVNKAQRQITNDLMHSDWEIATLDILKVAFEVFWSKKVLDTHLPPNPKKLIKN